MRYSGPNLGAYRRDIYLAAVEADVLVDDLDREEMLQELADQYHTTTDVVAADLAIARRGRL